MEETGQVPDNERRTNEPTKKNLEKLATLYGVTVDELPKTTAHKKIPASVGALTGKARTETTKSVLLIAF